MRTLKPGDRVALKFSRTVHGTVMPKDTPVDTDPDYTVGDFRKCTPVREDRNGKVKLWHVDNCVPLYTITEEQLAVLKQHANAGAQPILDALTPEPVLDGFTVELPRADPDVPVTVDQVAEALVAVFGKPLIVSKNLHPDHTYINEEKNR